MNLDALCARFGYQVIEDVAPEGQLPKRDKARLERTLTKGLGVLQEEGVYAFFLFLAYFAGQPENMGASELARRARELLKETDPALLTCGQDGVRGDFRALQDLATRMDDLLLAHQLLGQMLVYARYHAKALQESQSKGGQP